MKMKRDEKLLNYATVKAFNHDSEGKVKIWAVATDKRGMIIAEAGNSYAQTHPLQAKFADIADLHYKCFLHAEIAVLVKLGMNKRNVSIPEVDTLYVARSNNQGNGLNAKPCPICDFAISLFGIKRIIHT